MNTEPCEKCNGEGCQVCDYCGTVIYPAPSALISSQPLYLPRIQKLEAENARLRRALRLCADEMVACSAYPMDGGELQKILDAVLADDFDGRLRAALGRTT